MNRQAKANAIIFGVFAVVWLTLCFVLACHAQMRIQTQVYQHERHPDTPVIPSTGTVLAGIAFGLSTFALGMEAGKIMERRRAGS